MTVVPLPDRYIARNAGAPTPANTAPPGAAHGLTRRTLRVEEAAQVLGIGRCLVYDLIRSKRLRSIKIGARRLIPVAAIDEYLAAENERDIA